MGRIIEVDNSKIQDLWEKGSAFSNLWYDLVFFWCINIFAEGKLKKIFATSLAHRALPRAALFNLFDFASLLIITHSALSRWSLY